VFTASPIDAVITWVDGRDPLHIAARSAYMEQAAGPLHENAVNPHRWGSADEIYFCLRSIARNAPWIRKIWIVVDRVAPDLTRLPPELRAKINIVLHAAIFRDFSDALPTFNSLAIETVLWRIEGLAERFVYFNDDCFLTAPLVPGDLFDGMAPVLRGKWVNYADHVGREKRMRNPAKFNHYMQINAARIAGFEADRIFAAAHIAHPMRRSVLARLFLAHGARFEANLRHRFRDISQFLPQGLHNHACIASGEVSFAPRKDHLHIKSGCAPDGIAKRLADIPAKGIKFLCVNDLPQLEAAVAQASQLIEAAISGKRA
jgi:hypothetical protein